MSALVPTASGLAVRGCELVIATDAHEGPVYAADEDALYFTTVPRRSARLDVTLPLVSVRRLALSTTSRRAAADDVLFVTADTAIWAVLLHPAAQDSR